MTKKVDRSAHIGDSAISLIHTRVNEMGFVWHERKIDAGIDGSIELRDPATGEVNNRHFLVQSKGRGNRFSGENDRGFHFMCKQEDIDYWMSSEIPVLLVCSHPVTGEAWWAHVQGWFADPRRRATGRVDFDKATQRFDAGAASRLLALADPHGDAYVPVPAAKNETLTSNLLRVDLPVAVFRSPCHGRSPGDVYAAMRGAGGRTRHDWIMRGGWLYTWEPTEHSALRLAVDGPSKQLDAAAWSEAGADEFRAFVALLNSTFRDDQSLDCDWTADRKTIFFKATRDLRERKILSGSGRPKLVFHPKARKNGTGVSYYKHAALTWHFVPAQGQWYCALVATHHYTRDGHRESDYADDLRSGLKRLERNASVFGNVRMWAAFLKGEDNLLGTRETVLGYGDLLRFEVDQGIEDKEWLADHRPGAVATPDGENVEGHDEDLRLFE